MNTQVTICFDVVGSFAQEVEILDPNITPELLVKGLTACSFYKLEKI